MSLPNIILLGGPCVGKGTLANKLVKNFGYMSISTGYLVRLEAQRNPAIKERIEKGECISLEEVTEIIKKHIGLMEMPFILEGFPRTREQAKYLPQFVSPDSNYEILVLSACKEEVLKRCKGRLSCSKCNIVYNTEFFPPSKSGNLCDVCNAKLERREDDNKKTVLKRYELNSTEEKKVLSELKKAYQKERIHLLDLKLFDQLYEKVVKIIN